MVVAIHTHPFEGSNENLSYFFTQIFPRVAVPFFFALSGFSFALKRESCVQQCWVNINKYFKMYLIWSIVYYSIDIIKFFKTSNANFIDFFISCAKSFVFTGSHFHFWFFPALFFSIIVTTIIKYYRIHDKWLIFISLCLYAFGCLGCSYYNFAINIPGVSQTIQSTYFNFIRRVLLMGFPFFVSGYWVNRIYKSQNFSLRKNIKKLNLIYCLLLVLYLVEIYLVCFYSLQVNIFLTFMLYPVTVVTFLLLLINPLLEHNLLAKYCRYLANFVYCSHPLIITISTFVFRRFCGFELNCSTALFLYTTITTSVMGLIFFKVNKTDAGNSNPQKF